MSSSSNGRKPRAEVVNDTDLIDLDAARAQRIEAGGQKLTLRFGGNDITLPNPQDWPAEWMSTLMEGDLLGAAKMIIEDEDELAKFLSAKPTMGDLMTLFNSVGSKWLAVGGIPNSSASPPSLPATQQPSKPT